MTTARCPYCLGALEETRDAGGVVHCATCGTPHHGACFEEHTGCTIYGCGSRESVGERLAETDALIIDTLAAGRGALHPFLPLVRTDGARRFLAVERPEVSAFPGRIPRVRTLRLRLPAQVEADGRVTGRIDVAAPAPVLGQGLRLRVEAWLDGDDEPILVGREEAVLVGRAARGWLGRLSPWSRADAPLLAAGRTSVRFAFDAAPWAWTAPLPTGAGWGPRLRLRVSAVLDAQPASTTLLHLIEVRAFRRPLAAVASSDAPVDLPLWPPRVDAGWCVRPLVVPAGEEERPAGVFAVRRAEHDATTASALTLAAVGAGDGRIAGTVALALKRAPRRLGPIVLTCIGERRVGDGPWERVSGERAVVCDAPAPRADGAGRHTFEFEYAPPWPERAPPDDEARRVRLRATVVRLGHDLKSAPVVVVLRRRRRRTTTELTRGEAT